MGIRAVTEKLYFLKNKKALPTDMGDLLSDPMNSYFFTFHLETFIFPTFNVYYYNQDRIFSDIYLFLH